MKPRLKLKLQDARTRAQMVVSGLGRQPFGSSGAFEASSMSHPDLRRWTPNAGSPDADLLPDLALMRSRSRDMVRNQGLAAGALQTQLDNVLGCGLWLSPTPMYKLLGKDREWASEWRQKVKQLWQLWSETAWCDAARTLTLDGLATQFFSGSWTNGDGLALPLWMPEQGAPARLRVQLIESDRLSNPNFMFDTATMRGGIKINEFGAPQSYFIRKAHPGDGFWFYNSQDIEWEEIPATTGWGRRRVIHGAASNYRAGQSRGIPALAAVMKEFKVAGDYQAAELKAAVVNAMVALVTESAIGQEGLVQLLDSNPDALKMYMDGLSQRGRGGIDFEAGKIIPLMLGEKISSFTPGRPSTAYEPFITTVMRKTAAGLNMPYELFMKDFSQSNYSSARAALLESWRFFMGKRNWLSYTFYQPCYELFLEEKISAGEIEAPGFYENRLAYCRARWIGPGRGWVDPLKEAQAAELRMDILVSNLEDECAEQGKDWEEVVEQRAEEDKRLKKLGITRAVVVKSLQPKGAVDEQGGGDAESEGAAADPAKPGAPGAASPVVRRSGSITIHNHMPAVSTNIAEGAIRTENHVHVPAPKPTRIDFQEDANGNIKSAELSE